MERSEFKILPVRIKFLVKEKSSGEKLRAIKESEDNVFVYAKGRSRYGYRMMTDTFLDWYDLMPNQKTPAQKWQSDVAKVVKRLEKSGLWPEILERFKNLQKVSYEDRKAISEIYRNLPYKADRTELEYREIYGEYLDKYPFMFIKGDPYGGVDYFYLTGGMSDARVKSMYFGALNSDIKKRIAEAIKEDQKITEYGRTSYDVSFQYDPKEKKAWYSEEYKGCGNGHYYLALDGSGALFCEDD